MYLKTDDHVSPGIAYTMIGLHIPSTNHCMNNRDARSGTLAGCAMAQKT